MNLSSLSAEEALSSLGSGPGGLTAGEVARRQAEFGPNRIEAADKAPLWLALGREFTHFFALILWLAAGLAFFADRAQPGEGMGTLAWAIVGVIVVNGLFSFWQQFRAERALAALLALLPQQVEVMRGGVTLAIPADDLVPGDVILLGEGDKVPADCRAVEATGLRVSLATLTGESLPKRRIAEADDEPDPLAARNLLLAGTLVVSGQGRAVVFATGMKTEFGRIAGLAQATAEAESPLQREIRRVSHLVAVFAAGLGLVFFGIGHWLGLPFWANFMFAIGIIVANVPEGLLPTVTLALAMATQRMARRNALVRHLPAVETLGATTVICSDKTGTLTQNRMAVKRLFADNDFRDPFSRLPLPLVKVAERCHDLKFPEGKPLGDPMEIALWELSRRRRREGGGGERYGELAFDHERKRMSVVWAENGGYELHCKGAPESVLPCCVSHWTRHGVRPLDEEGRRALVAAQEDMAEQGLRVLALAGKAMTADEVPAEADLVFYGLVGLEDPPRPDVPEAVSRCRSAGVRIVMVTGDHPHTALAIAREIGLVREPDPVVLKGSDIAELTSAQLQLALAAPEVICARMSAEQKMRVVQALQQKGEVVAVTGDGVNDAPALKAADIGIAMGRSGTDVAREAADIVLLDDHFASIVNAIEEGRAVFANIRKFMTYILTSNIPEIVPYLAFVLLRIPLPLTVIQILAVDLGTDMLPALALGAEPPTADAMRQPPRPRHERLLSWGVLARAYLWLGPLEAVAGMAAFFFVLDAAGWRYGQPLGPPDPAYLAATTACLMAIVLTQVANLLVCRDARQPAWRLPLTANPLIWLGLAVEMLLLAGIVYTPWGHALFGTAPVAGRVWLYILPFALAMFALEEGRKGLVGRWRRTR
ncbi:MAG TPA: cation-transporting P-type ATPase [Rhodocyclaceae bacterium]|nr:cation-transporting P-type ATPase [Rhodocyclaceae bacterium]